MGTDEQERMKIQSDLNLSNKPPGTPRSPQVPKSAISFDENRNNKKSGVHKMTRFSFDKQISISSSSGSSTPPIIAKNHSPAPDRNKSRHQPSWLTRKSADWGATTTSGTVKTNGAAGHRRTEVMIVLMGSSRVGKSAIVNQFLHNIFRHDYAATVDELHWIEYDATNYVHAQDQKPESDHNSGTLLLKIMDASGSHEFIGMRKLYEQQGDAFILVVGLDDPTSFEEAKIIRQEITERNHKKAPVICVLNKIDLKHQLGERRVNEEDVRDFASTTQCLYVVVSATDHDSVSEIFKRLLQYNSIVPSEARLKYRRKSVPTAVTGSDFNQDQTTMRKALNHNPKKYLKSISETKVIEDHDKRASCIIC